MNCCPSAYFTFMTTGIEVTETNNQADSKLLQFFSFTSIESVSYNYSRADGGLIMLWIKHAKTPYRYTFPCSEEGKAIYKQLIGSL